jgi:hypothetical protein
LNKWQVIKNGRRKKGARFSLLFSNPPLKTFNKIKCLHGAGSRLVNNLTPKIQDRGSIWLYLVYPEEYNEGDGFGERDEGESEEE